MTARRRPPKKPGPTEPKNGDRWADVVLEKLHEHTALLEKQTVVVEQMRGQMVVLEQMRGQMDVVVERVNDTPTRGEVMDVMTHVQNLDGRMGLFEDALRQTRKEVAARFDGVDKELHGVRQDFARQAQGSDLRALEQRMTVVERHLGI